MPQVPSIKGAVFGGVAEEVKKLFESGDLSREAAGRRLGADDLALLDGNISIASRYEIGAFNRFSELLRDVVGDGSNDLWAWQRVVRDAVRFHMMLDL